LALIMPVLRHPSDLSGDSTGPARTTAVCVVGSGPAGALVAVELAEAGIDVIVLEAGSKDPDHRLEAMLDRVEVSGSIDLRFGFSRQLGGATNLWSGRVCPFEKIDFERRHWIRGSGWPITGQELEAYYARTGEILGIPGHSHFDWRRGGEEGFLSSDQIEVKTFQWAGKPFHAGDYLKTAAERLDNLRVVLNAPVTRLVEGEDPGSVEHGEIAIPGGGTRRVRARCFVIAAGGIDTPRLLLNSNSVHPAGMGNDHDVVGRYLSTHPKANMASLLLNRPVSTRNPLFTDRAVDGGLLRYGIGLSESTQREHGLLNHYVQLLPFLEYQANNLFERIKGSSLLDSPLIDRTPLVRGIVPGIGLIAFEAMGRLGRFQRRARKFILRAFLDQYPNAENRVRLSENRDDLGARRADVRWTWTEKDRESVIAFFRLVAGDLASRHVGRVDFSRLERTEDWPLVGLHSHFMGTTRMGDDPRSSVTTKDCRVHGVRNVYVAGPSLFPVYGYANPVYTIGALSLRLADHLKEKLK
jgi:choline dehydrogenase-like flavoprotein